MSKMTPDVRESVKEYLVASMVAYLKELAVRYFKNPKTSDNRQLLLEANAEALVQLTKDEPTGRAVLATFAQELQDKEAK